MSKNKKILATTLFAVATLMMTSTVATYAHWGMANDSTFISSFASKLGVSEDKVASAFESMKTERRQQMQADFETRLTTLVSQGKITEDQKQKIIAKHQEIQNTMESLDNTSMTMEDRRAAREKVHTQMKQWASDNGIDLSLIMPNGKGMRAGKMGGMRGGMMGWNK